MPDNLVIDQTDLKVQKIKEIVEYLEADKELNWEECFNILVNAAATICLIALHDHIDINQIADLMRRLFIQSYQNGRLLNPTVGTEH